MHTFTALLQRFDEKGEKTGRATLGWTYINIPVDVSQTLKPGQKTSFRVKGKLDNYFIEHVALVPMGEGEFIMAINATMRRSIRKEEGATIRVELEVDNSPVPLSADLLMCLEDEPKALNFFGQLTKGHQIYFSNWIESAKTIETKTKRITQAVTGLAMGMGYPEMIRHFKKQKP